MNIRYIDENHFGSTNILLILPWLIKGQQHKQDCVRTDAFNNFIVKKGAKKLCKENNIVFILRSVMFFRV